MNVLLTGATGFVGGHLLKRLPKIDFVRCMVRSPKSTTIKESDRIEIVQGDTLDSNSLRGVMENIDVAYYLIHAMNDDGDFQEQDRTSASNFLEAAQHCNVSRIVYLSGLANESDEKLSEHLASRLEVGRILRSSSIPCVEFRAAMVIGDGSLSFRMLEHLCNRLPLMLCPKWLSTPTQPVAIDDLLQYLLAARDMKIHDSTIVEIGSADQTTYMGMLKEYCRQKGLKRLMIPVPFLTTQLSSHWLALVTPETAKVGRDLIDGLSNPTIVRDQSASELFEIQPMSVADAIERAIAGNPEVSSGETTDDSVAIAS